MKHLSPKDRILKERGLVVTRPNTNRRSKLTSEIKATYSGKPKTALMKYLEQKYGVDIIQILQSGSLSVVAKRLGNEVDETTLSRWIKRFQLRYTADNLPSCKDCKRYGPACEGGVCYVLIDLELFELLPLKKKELL